MPNLENLISLVNKGFFVHNLSELLTECEELLQENENTLLIFTLKGLFLHLHGFHDCSPVTVESAEVLTAGLKERVLELLSDTGSVSWSSLEDLVSLYQSNKAKLQA